MTNTTTLINALRSPLTLLLLCLFTACANNNYSNTTTSIPSAEKSNLLTALESQSEKTKLRYPSRNPQQTLEFFEIKPGMTVIEVLPGRGWYTKILLPYLGSDGKIIGADYALDMWPNFDFMTPERITAKQTWVTTWTEQAEGWRSDNSAAVSAFQFGALAPEAQGSADAALFIRALHNLARFENQGNYLSKALDETFAALKPGGIVGIVQHQAREDRPDDWADGSNGYLKKSFLLTKMQAHGFEYIGASPINENPKDLAGEGDFVWRLPPSLNGTDDDPEKQAAMQAIGESNRMTLKFRKPI